MATVEIKNLKKSFGSIEVLHDINISINEGEFVAILGQSGCGKSTLLRIIAGLEESTSGEICIDDLVVNDLSPGQRDTAMVFQSYALYPHMSVRKNISFPLELARLSKAEIDKRVSDAIDMLDLQQVADRKPAQLSGGQRQRVAMGRALVREPKVFLFDEPLSNLDAKLRVQMRADIRALQRQLGTTSIYVTHDQTEAMTMADRVIVFNKGRVEQFGSPLELYDTPENVFVADFVGSPPMNLLQGEIDENKHFNCKGMNIKLANESVPSPQVTIGFRTENLKPCANKDATLNGVVSNIECTGDRTFVQFDVEGKIISMTSNQRHEMAIGELVPLQIEGKDIHLFDTETGQRCN